MPDPDVSRKLVEIFQGQMGDLAGLLSSGKIDGGQWQFRMRELMRKQFAMQLIAGSGMDKSQINPNEFLKLGGELRSQYLYLERFAADIRSGKLSPAEISRRAKMYAASSKQMFYQQQSPVKLPANPGDGSTPCKANCRCFWDVKIVKQNGDPIAIEARWMLGIAEHCPECVARSQRWNPLRLPYSENVAARFGGSG